MDRAGPVPWPRRDLCPPSCSCTSDNLRPQHEREPTPKTTPQPRSRHAAAFPPSTASSPALQLPARSAWPRHPRLLLRGAGHAGGCSAGGRGGKAAAGRGIPERWPGQPPVLADAHVLADGHDGVERARHGRSAFSTPRPGAGGAGRGGPSGRIRRAGGGAGARPCRGGSGAAGPRGSWCSAGSSGRRRATRCAGRGGAGTAAVPVSIPVSIPISIPVSIPVSVPLSLSDTAGHGPRAAPARAARSRL